MAQQHPDDRGTFADQAEEPSQTFAQEVWYLIVTHRRWVIAPIIFAIALLGVLVMLSGSGVGPFIYTLF